MEDEFIKATLEWYEYVRQDHYKDHDCHWYLNRVEKFSYGDKSQTTEYWEMVHNGYIGNEVYFSGDTREEVLKQTIDYIREYIKENPYENNIR